MNILRIVYDWPPPWEGLAPAPYYLSKAQAELGHRVTVLTGGLNGKRLFSGKAIEHPENGVAVLNLLRGLSSQTGPFLTTSILVMFFYFPLKILRRAQLVHGHGHIMLWFNLYKFLFGWIDRTPYISHFHISARDRYEQAKIRGEKQKRFENPLHIFSDWLAVRSADHCITVSQDIKEQLVKYHHANPEKITVVESGLATELFSATSKKSPEKKIPRVREILCVGILSPRKGPDRLIEALTHLPNEVHLRWIGSAVSPSYLSELHKLAKRLNVENRVHFEGYISNQEIAPYYYNADVFALPSQSEGLPKVVLEALACGLPVIASGFHSQTALRGLHYFSSLEPETIAKELFPLVSKRQTVDVDKVRKLFSWDAKAKEIEAVYSLVSSHF